MQIISRGVLCASLLLMAFSGAAQSSGGASSGDFQFRLEGAAGAIQYEVSGDGRSASGRMTFEGAIEISNEDVDGEDTRVEPVSELTLTVSLDCLVVDGNRAAMSGVVASSDVPEYIGARALLVVEDSGDERSPDGFTWGVYHDVPRTWVPSDAEVKDDDGALLSWWVSDAERHDDVGHPSHQLQNTTVDCKSFPFESYAFEAVADGDVQVTR